MTHSSLGISVPHILLPKSSVDLSKWAVVACDQYTSEPEYRQEVADIVEDAPSTLNIIYPEVYLEEPNKAQRIERIQMYMKDYVENVLEDKWPCFVLVDRKTSHVASRKWLVVALDLEAYDYSVGSQTLIRATEWTILDRLPPRIQIRTWAPIESPHIMVLIDDEEKTVIEPLFADTTSYETLYDTDLMMNGGHIIWYKISDEQKIQNVMTALEKLSDKKTFAKKYTVGDEKWVLLFAMGDGNHSFATAKAIREEKKKTLSGDDYENPRSAAGFHPARFALVELVNVHDEGLEFEPIHRVLFDAEQENFFAEMEKYFQAQWSEVLISRYPSKEEMKANLPNGQAGLKPSTSDHHYIQFVYEGVWGIIDIAHPKLNLEVGNLQAFLDTYLKQFATTKIDYVHGEETTMNLGQRPGNMWFLLPIMDKKDFFKTVVVDGALPRKTFSMGEAEEKRFYLECRKILK